MKILIVKGWLGFGDRLESLKMAVKYALDNNLQIYVDWTDSIWSHGSESFYNYFKLEMPSLKSLNDIPEDSTFYPSYWNIENISTSVSDELISKNPELNLGLLNEKIPKTADVLVFCSIGFRSLYEDSSFFAKVFRVIHPSILNEVRRREREHNLSRCLGIHVRGTDRVRNDNQRAQKIQWMAISAVHNGALRSKEMVGVSDDNISLQIWKNYFPQTVILSKLSLQNSNAKGNHNASKEDIQNSKEELNIDMLIDFFTLSLCEGVLSTYKDSRFMQEARRLHPVIRQILN